MPKFVISDTHDVMYVATQAAAHDVMYVATQAAAHDVMYVATQAAAHAATELKADTGIA